MSYIAVFIYIYSISMIMFCIVLLFLLVSMFLFLKLDWCCSAVFHCLRRNMPHRICSLFVPVLHHRIIPSFCSHRKRPVYSVYIYKYLYIYILLQLQLSPFVVLRKVAEDEDLLAPGSQVTILRRSRRLSMDEMGPELLRP